VVDFERYRRLGSTSGEDLPKAGTGIGVVASKLQLAMTLLLCSAEGDRNGCAECLETAYTIGRRVIENRSSILHRQDNERQPRERRTVVEVVVNGPAPAHKNDVLCNVRRE